MINEKQIQYMLTIQEEQNITAAAKRLYISQPALSRMLLDLEKELGAPLFFRDRGKMRPTRVGEIYLQGCRQLLGVSQAVAREISDLTGSQSGTILLGMTPMTDEFLLPHILDDFEHAFPGVELEPVEARASALLELVHSGKADMALVYQTNDPELEYQPLRTDPIYLQVPAPFAQTQPQLHPGVDNPPLPPDVLDGQPFILLKKGRGMRQTAQQLFEQFHITPGRVIETENIHVANRLVHLGRGFTLVPGLTARRFFYNDDNSIYCPVEGAVLERTLYACCRKNEYRSRAQQYLLKLIADIPSAKDVQ